MESVQHVYTANLRQDFGYPLLPPDPSHRLGEPRVVKGFQVGDVGYVDEHGGFVTLFNIGFPLPDKFREPGVPSCEPIKFACTHIPHAIPRNSVFMTGVERSLGESRHTYEFTATSKAGAILILPDGADLFELEDEQTLGVFRQLAMKYALEWCEHAQRDTLCLLTGVYSTGTWALGSFENGSPSGQILVDRQTRDDHTEYHWKASFPVHSRRSPRDNHYINQTIFIRGFKLTRIKRASVFASLWPIKRWLPRTKIKVKDLHRSLPPRSKAALARLRMAKVLRRTRHVVVPCIWKDEQREPRTSHYDHKPTVYPPEETGKSEVPSIFFIPESARSFFASVSSPAEILSSKLVSRAEGIDVIEGGYNYVHILDLDVGEPQRPFRFVLRFPIDSGSISRSQTRTAVGCMLYCQRHPDLDIPTPAVYAYSCTQGSEFIAMEYIDGDTLSDVWLDLSDEEQENMINQIAEVMHSMRTKTSFKMIGGIGPDGSACPLVDGTDAAPGRGVVDSFGLYNIGPYESVREYVQAVFDRQFHYLDQMLHKGTLSAHEAEFRDEVVSCLRHLTPEEGFERVKSKRDDFMAHPYECSYPFVLRHGDLHGRNVIVSHSSPRRILGILDWDFGGSHALPFADHNFELSSPDSDQNTDERVEQGEELYRSQLLINQLVGEPPEDTQLTNLVVSTKLYFLDHEAKKAQKDAVTSG